MRDYSKRIIAAAALAAVAWATPLVAQNDDGDTRGYQFNRDNVMNGILNPSDRLIERAQANIDRLPEETREDLLALQEALRALTETWVDEYRPGLGATLGEIRAARDAFVADMAEEIAASRELRKSVVMQLRNEVRDRFGDEEWSEEARALYVEYNAIKLQLATAWRAIVGELGDDATREDVAAARERFKEANVELIAQEKELAQQIRNLIRENVRENRPVVERQPLPAELQSLRDEMRAEREALRAERQAARAEMASMTSEEREAKRAELLEKHKEAHNDMKERRRQLIEDLKNEKDGDRRAED